jgi:hypothetical protein
MSPTPVVVLMSVDSTRDQYDNLVDGFLKSDTPVTDQIIFDTVNFRAFTAELDDCDVISLLDNPSVSTVSLDAIGNMETLAGDALLANTNSSSGSNPSVISRDVVDMTTRRHILNHTLLDRDIPEASQELEQQGAFFDGSAPVLNSPSHLGWLTATWAQIGLAGQDTCK